MQNQTFKNWRKYLIMNTIPISSIQEIILKTTSDPGPAGRDHDFDSLFIEAVYSKFERSVILDMQYAWDLFRKGFEAAKKSNFDIADYYYKKGEDVIKNSGFDDNVLKYLNIYVTPKLSYYHYKKGNYETANELTWKSLFETEEIETEFPNMHMAKIQQLHNIARVAVKQKKYDEAHKYEKAILDYHMLHKIPDLPGKWSTSLLKNCDEELVSLMTFQVFSEKMVNLMLFPDVDEKLALDYFVTLDQFVPGFPGDETYIAFSKAINSLKTSDYQALLKYSGEVLSKGYTRFNAFKHYLILQLLSKLDTGTLHNDSESLFTEALQNHIRVTPLMLTKYQTVFQSMTENIS